MLRTIVTGAASVVALIALAGCSGDPQQAPSTSSATATSAQISTPAVSGSRTPEVGGSGHPTKTVTAPGPGASPKTAPGSSGGGSWDREGNPVNGGPRGADGSTGNNLTKKYCAQNRDPACPAGAYVAPDAILSPDGSGNYAPCEGTVCTNPNHGGGDSPIPSAAAPAVPTSTVPGASVRDDDPGGKPCMTGMGVAGTYVYSDDSDSWVCQIG